jgi:F-type H+-transporting ATPase subunit b
MQGRSKLARFTASLVLTIAFSGMARGLPAQESAHAPPGQTAESKGEAAHPGGEKPINPLQPEPKLTIWTLVVFIGLMFVLGRYAWQLLLKALHNREQHLEHVLVETERARNEAESLRAEHRKQMARAGEEVRAILEKARQDAQAAADSMIKHAQSEADAARQRAQRDIAAARDAALAEIWQKSADMAVSVAGTVLRKQLNEQDHRRLLDSAIDELRSAPRANGHGRHSS